MIFAQSWVIIIIIIILFSLVELVYGADTLCLQFFSRPRWKEKKKKKKLRYTDIVGDNRPESGGSRFSHRGARSLFFPSVGTLTPRHSDTEAWHTMPKGPKAHRAELSHARNLGETGNWRGTLKNGPRVGGIIIGRILRLGETGLLFGRRLYGPSGLVEHGG